MINLQAFRSASKPNDKKFGKSNANNTKSKNTKSNKTKLFRKATALTTETGGEGSAARSHIAYTATRKQKEETNDTALRSGSPPTQKQTPTHKRVATIETAKPRQPAYIGKPLTQEEIDEKKKQGRNASGFTPLAGIIPASHWQELEARARSHPPTHGTGSYYHQTTKNTPLSIDATIEEISCLLLEVGPGSVQKSIISP
jgi:hypothetical protein